MEELIIQRAQQGDQLAFQQLIMLYHTLAWRTAQVLLSQETSVEDVMQEVWLDVWRGLPRFHSARPFRPWLLTIVANRCHMSIRRHQITYQPLETADIEPSTYEDEVVAHILRLEEDAELKSALNKLSAEHRHVLELRFFAELDLQEIALITHTSVGTVKSRLHRARQSLRAQLHSRTKAREETKQ